MPLLWGAMCLGIWLLIEVTRKQDALAEQRIDPLFWGLLASLAAMIVWRSRDLPNTLAASLCLAGIGLATCLSARLHAAKTTHVIAWGWLLAGLANAAWGLAQYFGFTAEPAGTVWLDGIVNGAGKVTVAIGRFTYKYVDQGVVDTIVNASGAGAEGSGQLLRKQQTGKVQAYGAYLFAGATLLA